MKNWIECKLDLPGRGVRVIGYDEFYGRIGEAVLANNRLVFVDNDDCNITHWLNFPATPNKIMYREERILFYPDDMVYVECPHCNHQLNLTRMIAAGTVTRLFELVQCFDFDGEGCRGYFAVEIDMKYKTTVYKLMMGPE